MEGDMRQYRLILLVGKADVVIAHVSADLGKRDCAGGVFDFWLCVNYIQEAAEAGKTFLHHLSQLD